MKKKCVVINPDFTLYLYEKNATEEQQQYIREHWFLNRTLKVEKYDAEHVTINLGIQEVENLVSYARGEHVDVTGHSGYWDIPRQCVRLLDEEPISVEQKITLDNLINEL